MYCSTQTRERKRETGERSAEFTKLRRGQWQTRGMPMSSTRLVRHNPQQIHSSPRDQAYRSLSWHGFFYSQPRPSILLPTSAFKPRSLDFHDANDNGARSVRLVYSRVEFLPCQAEPAHLPRSDRHRRLLFIGATSCAFRHNHVE